MPCDSVKKMWQSDDIVLAKVRLVKGIDTLPFAVYIIVKAGHKES